MPNKPAESARNEISPVTGAASTDENSIGIRSITCGKTVVLVRHFFADSGSVEDLYNEYLTGVITKNIT